MTSSSDPRLSVAARDSAGAGAVSSASASASTGVGTGVSAGSSVGDTVSLQEKWRLILGKRAESDLPLNQDQEWSDCSGNGSSSGSPSSEEGNRAHRRYYLRDIDESLDYIYQSDEEEIEQQSKTLGGRERPQLIAAKWLTKTKQLFPSEVYEIIQKDALARNKILTVLQDEEFVSRLEPNMDLLTSILAMKNQIRGKALDNAKLLVEKVVEQLKDKFRLVAQRSFYGKRDMKALPVRTFRNLDMPRIVRANLKHYQQEGQFIIPQQLYFKANSIKRSLHHLFVVVDQSGSMLDSYAHASILASVFAKLPCLQTRLICYSTDFVDYTKYLDDVVELLFKSQLGGGTETCKALAYVEQQITEPKKTVVVLISDLYDSEPAQMLKMSERMMSSGVKFIVLPAIGSSSPSYYKQAAEQYAALGAHVGCMTPDRLIDFVSQVVSKS